MTKTNLAKYFWDVDFTKIDFKKDYLYVINRLLDKGDLSCAKWVINNYSESKIIETFKIKRDFSPKTGTFWSNYLNIPQEAVVCLNPSYRMMRKQLWPF